MSDTETQNIDPNAQGQAAPAQDGSSETPETPNVAAELKELQRQLQEEQTKRATLEARYEELSTQGYQNPQQPVAQQQPLTLEQRTKKIISGAIDDPEGAEKELAGAFQDLKSEILNEANYLNESKSALDAVNRQYPHLALVQDALVNRAQELYNKDYSLNYGQALSKVAEELDTQLKQQLNVQTTAQTEPQQTVGTQGMMRQAPPATPPPPREEPSMIEEIGQRNKSLANKLL